MQHTVSTEDQALVISLKGELDHHSAASLRTELDRMIDESTFADCIIDMTGVSFMDSSGLGVLLGRYKLITEKGGHLTVRNPNRTIDRILKMSGIYSIVEVTKKESLK